MKICIIHFASSLLRFFLATIFFLEFVYYWCYLDVVFTILQRIQFPTKKIYSTQDQYFFQKIKSYGRWQAEKLTVKFYLVPGVRNRKFYLVPGVRNGKIYLVPNDSYEKFLFESQRVKNRLNPQTAVSRGYGYISFVTMYSQPVILIERYMKKTDRQPAVRLERYMKFGTASRRSGYTHGPLFKNRKQNIICSDFYGCTINRIYKKTLQYVYLGFSVGVGVVEKLCLECESKNRYE